MKELSLSTASKLFFGMLIVYGSLMLLPEIVLHSPSELHNILAVAFLLCTIVGAIIFVEGIGELYKANE